MAVGPGGPVSVMRRWRFIVGIAALRHAHGGDLATQVAQGAFQCGEALRLINQGHMTKDAFVLCAADIVSSWQGAEGPGYNIIYTLVRADWGCASAVPRTV